MIAWRRIQVNLLRRSSWAEAGRRFMTVLMPLIVTVYEARRNLYVLPLRIVHTIASSGPKSMNLLRN